MLRSLRRVRLVEVQLLITVLLFFAAGYLLVIATGRNANLLQLNINSVADILWPSSLPLLLYLLVSAGLSYRNPNADQLLLPLVALLSGLGLMFTARLEPVFDRIFVNDEGQPIYGAIAAKQSLFVTIGVILLVLMVFVDWDRWIFIRLFRTSMMDWLKNHRWTWMIFGLLLMLLTFAIGVDPNGSGVKVWFRLPGGFLFQPAELLKIVLVIFLASYLVEHREVVSAGYRIGRITLPPLPYLVPMVLIWGLGMGLIVMQSDLGAALLLFGIFVAMLYVATGKAWYAFGSFASFAIGAFVMYKFIGKVEERVALWLDPWNHVRGYQMIQSQYALSAGGVGGRGLGLGTPYYVPAVHTDYAYSGLGEELGLLGTVAIVLVYALLVYRGYHIALAIKGRFRGFEQLLAVGLTTILAVQALIIIGGNLLVIPLTGITMPFISYGGSSVLINFIIVGLLLRISATTQQQ
ncbi:MAG: FtsW/RodA/SpoVE family cell cycle protein [Herpetosiphon sp.]|nr:FtsW/RodA/SpoVE family cell cycle protein [Herpetosiphon sp.]